ncbi:MAG TPA: extracellular solute-binding protein [Clostridiaceae bacterium]|nr:extracellular solute-binding protein [Clostridiaceae bacterium]
MFLLDISIMVAVLIIATILSGCQLNKTADVTSGTQTTAATNATDNTNPNGFPDYMNAEGYPILKEKTVYTVLAPRKPSEGEWNSLWIFKEIERRFNIKFEITNVNKEAWDEKKNLAFATGDIPDCFLTGITKTDLLTYGSQGLIIDVGDMVEKYAPNIITMINEYPNIKKMMLTPDGKMYGIFGAEVTFRGRTETHRYINMNWLNKLNMDIPKTTDDFYQFLLGIKNNDLNGNGENDEIPQAWKFAVNDKTFKALLQPFGLLGAYQNVDDNGNVFYGATDIRYKSFLAYLNKLYSEGLIDKECFSQSDDQYKAKGAMNLYGAFSEVFYTFITDPEIHKQFDAIPPLTSEVNDKQIWPSNDGKLNNALVITSKCKKPEALVAFMNWVYTQEGTLTMRAGVENGKWEGGEGGWQWTQLDNGEKAVELIIPEGYKNFNDFRNLTITPMVLPFVNFDPPYPSTQYMEVVDPGQAKYSEHVRNNYLPYYKTAYPDVMLTVEELDEISVAETDVKSYISQMTAKFITGEVSINEFDNFVKGCKDRGLDKLIKVYTDAYERWNSN